MKRCSLLFALMVACWAKADLPAEISLAQTAGFEGAHVQRFYGPEPLAIVGGTHAIAYGNVDGDAYDDLIVGIPEYGQDAGIVYVIYGSASYSAFEYALAPDPLANVRMTIINGAQGRVGESVAAADVDGDGYDDVVIGCPSADVPSVSGAGACAIVYGSADMPGTPQGTGSVVTLDITNTTIPNGITYYYGIDPGDLCGQAVAAGDLTNDGLADVAVGAPGATVTGNAAAGEAYLFKSFVNRRGVGLNANGNPSNDHWYKIYGGSSLARLGTSLAIGDLNGDGYADTAIGATGVGGGRVYCISGGGDLIGFLLINFSATGFGEISGTGNDDLFGKSIAIGNFDGDQGQDLLVGAPKADGAQVEDGVGGVFLVHGGSTILTNFIPLNGTPGTYGESRVLGAATGSGLGENVALGDVNGDGMDDIIYSRTALDSVSGTAVGRLHVSYASGSFPTVLDLATDTPDVTVYGGSTNDNFGVAVASLGDMDNDGASDFTAASAIGLSPYGTQPNQSGYTATVFGSLTSEDAFIQQAFPSGQTPMFAIGSGHLSPTFRTWAQFNAGTSAYLQVELKRTPEDLTNLGPSAKEYWILATPRTGWTSCTVTLQYTDAQIEGISSSHIKLATSPDADGPWVEVTPDINIEKRTLSFVTSELGYYAIHTDLPVITLIGESEIFHACGTPYVDDGATASDAEDGDLTGLLDVQSTVDVQNPGIYTVTYNVSDSNSNVAQTVVRTVTVQDLAAPQVLLNGNANVFLQCGTPYNELGAVGSDACDGSVTVNIDSSALQSNTPGDYQVNYSAFDQAGNNTQVSRTIQVVDTTGPVITLIGNANYPLNCNEPYFEPGATAQDACDGDLTGAINIKITNLGTSNEVLSIDSSTAGSYRVDYDVLDALSNAATTVSRTVTVLNNCDLTAVICTTDLNASQQVPSNPSSATGTATWTQVGTDKVVLRITHNVSSPTMAHIHVGAPGANGAPINDFGDPASPIVAVFTNEEYNAFIATPHYLNIHSTNYSAGEIRGNITCAPIGGEDGFQTADKNGDNVIQLAELLRVIQFYNSFGYHCADNPGDTEDGYVPGPGANKSCTPYDTDYNTQDWLISLAELLRVIQFYNSFGYHYCPQDGTEDDFCPGL